VGWRITPWDIDLHAHKGWIVLVRQRGVLLIAISLSLRYPEDSACERRIFVMYKVGYVGHEINAPLRRQGHEDMTGRFGLGIDCSSSAWPHFSIRYSVTCSMLSKPVDSIADTLATISQGKLFSKIGQG
jgi:hypothetical protein